MPRVYHRRALAEAVRDSTTLTEVLQRIGLPPTAGRRSYVRSVARSWSIDLSHLEREGVRHTSHRLHEVVRASSSVAEVVRRLGLKPVGGNEAHIGRRIVALGIDTSHFRVPRPGRSMKTDILVYRAPECGRVPGVRLRRELLARGVAHLCAMCGNHGEWNGKPLRLEVDHVSGEWWDNRIGNLRLLCPNCHAVTDTYHGKKRGPRSAQRAT